MEHQPVEEFKLLYNELPSPLDNTADWAHGIRNVPLVLSWWVTVLIPWWPRLLLVLLAPVCQYQISFSLHAMMQKRLGSAEIISPQT